MGVSIIICGGDEAGRGAVIGPLVISLVSVKKSSLHRLSEIGVRDSKLLTKKRRDDLFDEIREIATEVKVDKIYPSDINEAMRNRISLNELEAFRFARLFDETQGDVNTVYLDSPDVVPEKFGMRFQMSSSRPLKIVGVKSDGKAAQPSDAKRTRVIAEHKADVRYPIVSAASIIAKVTRDKEIKRLEKDLRMKLGSGYPSDKKTVDVIRANLKNEAFNHHIRQGWQTMRNIKQTRLTSF